MDINKFIVDTRQKMPNALWRTVANTVNSKFGTDLSDSAVCHRYQRTVRNSGEESRTTYVDRERGLFPKRYIELTDLGQSSKNVLVIGDTHLPFTHSGYLDFLKRVQYDWRCETVVHIGDFVDNYALSSFAHDPDGLSAGSEYDRVCEMAQEWYEAFPEVIVCIGNHDKRHIKQAASAGIPTPFMRSYEEVWDQPPGWIWGIGWKINGVVYEHGSGGGKNAALSRAYDRGASVVMGHVHTWAGVQWYRNERGTIYGMNVGCGIDRYKYAFAYLGQLQKLPSLGCGVVMDRGRQPLFIPFEP